jgi:small-conductance mechanosensitive channel
MGDRNDVQNLRDWLNRIEETCASRGASLEMIEIRNAALAALSGKPAPKGFGIRGSRHD